MVTVGKKCKPWIHKRDSGVRGDLSLVVNGLRCKQCDGAIPEADLANDLVAKEVVYSP